MSDHESYSDGQDGAFVLTLAPGCCQKANNTPQKLCQGLSVQLSVVGMDVSGGRQEEGRGEEGGGRKMPKSEHSSKASEGKRVKWGLENDHLSALCLPRSTGSNHTFPKVHAAESVNRGFSPPTLFRSHLKRKQSWSKGSGLPRVSLSPGPARRRVLQGTRH